MCLPWLLASANSLALFIVLLKCTSAEIQQPYPVGRYTAERELRVLYSELPNAEDKGREPPLKQRDDPRSECILLFGAFCNGNMGDVVQANAMEDLLRSVAPDQCFWYGHPWKESTKKKRAAASFRIGEFFGRNSSRVLPLSPTSAPEVNRFKAMVIGGGGIFVAQHVPLPSTEFAEQVNIPIAIVGVGANYRAKHSSTLLEKAVFISGRDDTSVKFFAATLRGNDHAIVAPEEVEAVRDPVLSCKLFSDTDGECWRESEGTQQPLCFVLPASTSNDLDLMHQHLVANVVRPEDVFVNVFPKHQKEVEAHGYPGEIETVLDPEIYTEKMCSCRAIISSRLHGAILGLQMGIPTFGAWYKEPEEEHKVVDLMVRVMQLPDQYIRVNENLTRVELEDQVDRVVQLYREGNRRVVVHDTLEGFHREFQSHASHIMGDILGIELPDPGVPSVQVSELSVQLEPESAPDTQEEVDVNEAARAVRKLGMSLALLAFIVTMATRRQRKTPKEAPAGRSLEGGDDLDREISKQDLSTTNHMLTASNKTPAHDTLPASRFLLVFDFIVWVSLAVGFSAYGKGYLRRTRDPAGLLTLQGVVGVAILAALGLNDTIDLDPIKELRNAAQGRIGWVGILHTGQALLTNVAVLVGGVAVTNAVKAMEPVAAAALSYFILGKQSSRGKIIAITTIVTGITILTWKPGGSTGGGRGGGSAVTSSSFVTISAVCLNALRNVVLKKGQPVPSHVTLYVCSAVAAVVGVLMVFLNHVIRRLHPETAEEAEHEGWLQMSGFNASLCFVGYNFASFNILNHLSPVGHAVGNSCKRMLVFASGLVILGEVMAMHQFAGAVVALVGVMAYNLVAARS